MIAFERNSVSRFIIKAFLWIYGLFSVLILLSVLLLSWGPAYLAITQGERYDWLWLAALSLKSLLDLAALALLYSYAYKHRFMAGNEDKLLRSGLAICYIIYTILMFLAAKVVWEHLLILPILLLILAYPKSIINLFARKKTEPSINTYAKNKN